MTLHHTSYFFSATLLTRPRKNDRTLSLFLWRKPARPCPRRSWKQPHFKMVRRHPVRHNKTESAGSRLSTLRLNGKTLEACTEPRQPTKVRQSRPAECRWRWTHTADSLHENGHAFASCTSRLAPCHANLPHMSEATESRGHVASHMRKNGSWNRTRMIKGGSQTPLIFTNSAQKTTSQVCQLLARDVYSLRQRNVLLLLQASSTICDHQPSPSTLRFSSFFATTFQR